MFALEVATHYTMKKKERGVKEDLATCISQESWIFDFAEEFGFCKYVRSRAHVVCLVFV